jgi:hypothetical protein
MVGMELTKEAERYGMGWHILEKNKPERKPDLIIDEARQMHPDNRYRLTFSKLLGTYNDELP